MYFYQYLQMSNKNVFNDTGRFIKMIKGNYFVCIYTSKEYKTVLNGMPKYVSTCSSLGLSTPVSRRTGSHGTLVASRPDPITLTGNVYSLLQSLNGNAHIIILGPVRMVIYHRTYFAFPSSNASQFLQSKKLVSIYPRNPQNSPTTQSPILTASLTGRGRIKLGTKKLKIASREPVLLLFAPSPWGKCMR